MKKIFAVLLMLVLTLGLTSVAYAAYDNPYGTTPSTIAPAPAMPFTAPLGDGDTQDNGIGNANNSGGSRDNAEISNDTNSTMANMDANNIIKSKDMRASASSAAIANQRTHGAYKNNTNSCASCHQTHTGASKDLLIKRGVYNTCTACHDGTLGFYNVFTPSTAGTFGGTKAGNASVHLANGTLTVDMAPGYLADGANPIATDNFDCASCHAPHGSYSDRILHYSPNGMADIAIENRGNKLVNRPVADVVALPAASAASPDFLVVRGTAADAGIPVAEEAGTTPVIYVMKKLNTAGVYSYVRDTNPWVAGFEHAMDDTYRVLKMAYYTDFSDASGKVKGYLADGRMDGTLIPMYGKAYAKGSAIGTIVTANIARAYVVKFNQIDADPVNTYFGGIRITKIDTASYDTQGNGINISNYCGACHTEYMTHSGDAGNTGVFRHSTDKDRFNCLKCHFAHGTDVTVMADATDNTVATLVAGGATLPDATAYILDKNPSSALKRYTNMAVCWKCHSAVEGKSSKLQNNTEYWTDYATNPKGVNGYTANWLDNTWE